MGFYIRKSLSFGPIRFNLSKSGVGMSAGIKGFRIGSGPRGNYVHMGRGGLYYRASLPLTPHTPSDAPENLRPSSTPAESDVVMLDIDSANAGQIVDASSRALVSELQTKRNLRSFAPVAIVAGIVAAIALIYNGKIATFGFPILAFTFVAYAVLKFWDNNRKTTVIFYNLVDDAESVYREVYKAFETLSTAQKIWHIPSSGKVRDRKYHSGAGEVVKRVPTAVNFENPPYVRTNIPTPSLVLGMQTLYFFPDKILVFEGKNVGGLSYGSLSASITTTAFIESDGVPSDSRVIGQTWRYVNKNGGPDRRFKDNYQIPIAQYEEVHFTSTSGLNELLHISRIDSFQLVLTAVESMNGLALNL